MYDPIQTGPQKGVKLNPEDMEKMLDEYYKLRGWDNQGIPLEETLQKYQLTEYLKDLKKIKKSLNS